MNRLEKEKQLFVLLSMAKAMDEICISIKDSTTQGEKLMVSETQKSLFRLLRHYDKVDKLRTHEGLDSCVEYFVEHFGNLVDLLQEP
jgi:hypothetical protein